MKRLVLFLFVGIFLIGVVSAGTCEDNRTIMKLYNENNSHGAIWNDTNYDVDICYDGVVPVTPHPVCNETNSFLWLSGDYNGHASLTQSVDYSTGVCYGDLTCHNETITVAGNNCSDGSEPILSLYSGTNSHMAEGNYDGYDTKICCGVVAPTSDLYWADANGVPLDGRKPNIGDTVRAVKTGASSGTFNILEDNVECFLGLPIGCGDDEIISIDGENINGNLVGKWVITKADLDKTSDLDKFYFNVDGGENKSDYLSVNTTPHDSPMQVTILSPACGSNYDKSDAVTISVSADDEDDVISGNVSIGGVVVSEGVFENGVSSFNHTFVSAGNYKIEAVAVNSQGYRARHISNIMIIDVPYVNGSKYVAACIDEPENYDDIQESEVTFSALSTRAIEINNNIKNIILPGNPRLSWHWTFVAPNGQPANPPLNFVNNASSLAYRFGIVFPIAGDNSATLWVEFD